MYVHVDVRDGYVDRRLVPCQHVLEIRHIALEILLLDPIPYVAPCAAAGVLGEATNKFAILSTGVAAAVQWRLQSVEVDARVAFDRLAQ